MPSLMRFAACCGQAAYSSTPFGTPATPPRIGLAPPWPHTVRPGAFGYRVEDGVAAAVDVTLLGRFYERFADHAVEIGRRVVFEATGEAADE